MGPGSGRAKTTRNVLVAGIALLLLIVAAQEVRERIHVRRVLSWPMTVLDGFLYSPAALGEGGPAADLKLFDPMGIAVGPSGEIYFSDRGRDKGGRIIWRIDHSNTARLVAGSGRRGEPHPGSLAKASDLSAPEGLAFGPDQRLYFADSQAHRIFRIEHDGTLSVVAGTGEGGFSGDGGRADTAMLYHPADIRFDAAGNLYIADVYNQRIRRVSAAGIIETVAGTGEAGYSGDGGPAVEAQLDYPWGIFVDTFTQRLLVVDGNNHRVREVDETGFIVTRVGSGIAGYGGDGQDAQSARLDTPQSLGFDCEGRMYIGDEHNHAIRIVDVDRTIHTFIGNGSPGFADDGAMGSNAALNDPENMVVLCDGSLYVTDGDNARVLFVTPDGTVRNVAGRGP